MHDCPLCDTYIHDQLEFPTEPEHLEYHEELVRIIPEVKAAIKAVIKEHMDVIDMFRGFACKDVWEICEDFPNSNMIMTDCMNMIRERTGMRIRASKHWFVQRITSILVTIYEIHQEHTSGLECRNGKGWESTLPFAKPIPVEEIQRPDAIAISAKRQASFFDFLC